MNLIDFSSSFVSLLPAIVALALAIITRRVLLSLGVGILLGAVLLSDLSVAGTLAYIGKSVSGVFIEDGLRAALVHDYSDIQQFIQRCGKTS